MRSNGLHLQVDHRRLTILKNLTVNDFVNHHSTGHITVHSPPFPLVMTTADIPREAEARRAVIAMKTTFTNCIIVRWSIASMRPKKNWE